MIKEAIGKGATIEEAKENAVLQLQANDFDDIQFDVIAMPKAKVLGIFGGSQAEVKAYIEVEERHEKPTKKEKAKKEKNIKAEAPKKEQKTEPKKASKQTDDYGEAVSAKDIAADSPAGKAVAYIKPILAAMNCGEPVIKVASREGASLIIIDGDDLSILIGHRGETLDALQYLAGLAASNGDKHYKISLNIGNYREKREETLKALAARISAQVLKTGKSRSLEPMNPYERRIIHTAVQEIEGVTSASFGDGNARRVVIGIEGEEMTPPRFNDRRRNDRNHNRGRRNDRRSSAKTVTAPQREPKSDIDTPLYGKIN